MYFHNRRSLFCPFTAQTCVSLWGFFCLCCFEYFCHISKCNNIWPLTKALVGLIGHKTRAERARKAASNPSTVFALVFFTEAQSVGRRWAHNVDSQMMETGILLSPPAQELKPSYPPAAVSLTRLWQWSQGSSAFIPKINIWAGRCAQSFQHPLQLNPTVPTTPWRQPNELSFCFQHTLRSSSLQQLIV